MLIRKTTSEMTKNTQNTNNRKKEKKGKSYLILTSCRQTTIGMSENWMGKIATRTRSRSTQFFAA
jgi:hypothetical protein